jgi:hypothetical protein
MDVLLLIGVVEIIDLEEIEVGLVTEGVDVDVELVSEVVDMDVDVIRLIVVFDMSLEILYLLVVAEVRVEVLMISDVMENVGMIIDPEDIEVAFVKVLAVVVLVM